MVEDTCYQTGHVQVHYLTATQMQSIQALYCRLVEFKLGLLPAGLRDPAKHRLMSRAAELDPEGVQPLSEKEQHRLESARQGQPNACAAPSSKHASFSLSRRWTAMQLACMSLTAAVPGPALAGGPSRAQSTSKLRSQAGDTDAEVIRPPKTLKRPHKLVSPDGEDVRQDPYYWLRDDKRESPEVIRHLEVSHHISQPDTV